MADRHPASHVAALEISRRRMASLVALTARWGAANVQAVAGDAGAPPFRPEAFDSVLLDAPCSGLGTLGRNPDIRWHIEPVDIDGHAQRQTRLLGGIAGLVKPGGRLVYSACTLEREETEDVAREFLQDHPDFTLVVDPPAWAAAFAEAGFLRVRPEAHPGDGFFAAVFVRATLRG